MGKDKVKKISEYLRKEALDPARKEAEQIVESAKKEARAIIDRALSESEDLMRRAKEKIGREKEIFDTSLASASRQALESLRQQIEKKLFHSELRSLLEKKTQEPAVLAELIRAVVHALEKEGAGANLSVFVPASVPAEKVNALLGGAILDKLKEKGVLLSSIGGGIEVKLKDQQITIDLSSETLKELLAGYIRKDFRTLFFGEA